MTLETRISEIRRRAEALPRGGKSRLAMASGLALSTVQTLIISEFKPKSVDNIIRIERALDEIEREGNAA